MVEYTSVHGGLCYLLAFEGCIVVAVRSRVYEKGWHSRIDLALHAVANSNAITLDTSLDGGELEHEIVVRRMKSIVPDTESARVASRGFVGAADRSTCAKEEIASSTTTAPGPPSL